MQDKRFRLWPVRQERRRRPRLRRPRDDRGREFIEAYDSFKPTTIILDMIMPGMDGNEIVLWLAQQKCTARLIIMTGYTPDYAADAKVLAEYKGLQAVITLSKPIDVSELRAVLGSQESS